MTTRKVALAFVLVSFVLFGYCVSEDATKSRSKRFVAPINLEKVRTALIAPSSISNQMTVIIVIQTITALGWLIAGKHHF
jgi:hypothetical protein